jgi:hypothetical protein
MTTRIQQTSLFWKWALIVSELVLLGELIATRITPLARQFTGVSAMVAVLAGVAWVFLLFGSPFLVPTQRWLAIVGWCIAVAAILLPFL